MNRENALGNLIQRKMRFSIKNNYLGFRREGNRTIVLVLRTPQEEGEILDGEHQGKQWYELNDELISRRILKIIIRNLNHYD